MATGHTFDSWMHVDDPVDFLDGPGLLFVLLTGLLHPSFAWQVAQGRDPSLSCRLPPTTIDQALTALLITTREEVRWKLSQDKDHSTPCARYGPGRGAQMRAMRP